MWGYLASQNLHVSSGWNHRHLRCRPTHAHPVESFTSCFWSVQLFFSKKILHLKLSTVFSKKPCIWSFQLFFRKKPCIWSFQLFSRENLASEACTWSFQLFFRKKTLHLKLSTLFFEKKNASDAWKARDGWKPRIHLWSGLSQQVHGATVCFLDGLSQQVFNCGQQVHLQVTCQNLRPQDFISTISLLAASSLASYVTKPFQWFAAPEGRKVGSLKRRLRSQLASWEMTNCTPLWREAHFQAKMYKTPGSRSTFGSWDVEKVHAVVARSTFASQNAQNAPGGDHFWELRGRKSVRRCGAKHISRISTQQVHCETICLVDGLSQQGHCKTIIFSHADFSGIQWPEHCKVSNPRP